MTRLEKIIESAVNSYRTTFFFAAVFAFTITVFQQNWLGLIALGPILICVYFVGLWITGQLLGLLVDKEILREEFIAKRIEILNEKIANGEIGVDDPELAEEMKRAGLRPLAVITELGPVFGRQFDADIHEWIDANDGDAGLGRYVYAGPATWEVDGTVSIPDMHSQNLFVVLDGILYERVVEQVD